MVGKIFKYLSLTLTLALVLSLGIALFPTDNVCAATQIYEFYDNSDVADGLSSPAERLAQTFIARTEYHTVSQVSLYLERDGNPGTITVSLRATDGSGYPTGPSLAETNVPENEIPLTPAWVNIIIGPHDLVLNTRYAIVVSASNPSYMNELWWYSDTGQYYTDGAGLYSDSGGASWAGAGVDRTFAIYGEPITTVTTATGSGDAGVASSEGSVQNLTAVDESTLSTEGKPNLDFPNGFFSFEITGLSPGDSTTVTLVLPQAVPVGSQYWKYHEDSGWYRIMPVGDDDGDNVITFNLIDGAWGNDDDGQANGTIVDAGGVGELIPITANFTADQISGAAPLTVQFTDTTTGAEATSWLWDFGDLTTSTDQNPTHVYYTPDTYTVSLTVNGGEDDEIKEDYINVTASASEVWVDDDW